MKKIIFTIAVLLCFMPIINAENNYEAQIGEVKYSSVTAALNAAKNNDEIILLKDVSEIVIETDKKITINLNKHAVTNKIENKGSTVTLKNGTVKYGDSREIIYNNSEGNMIIEDIICDTSSGFYCLTNQGTATINNGKFYVISNGGNLTINDGDFYTFSLYPNGNGGTLTINGGNFEGVDYITPIFANSISATLTINGGNFKSNNGSVISNPMSNVVINNGNFNAIHAVYSSGTINNDNKIESIVTVNGGTFNTTKAVFFSDNLSGHHTLIINGGDITGTSSIIDYLGIYDEVFIKGGNLTYNGKDGDKVISVIRGDLIIGEDDNKVKDDTPIINLNGGIIYVDEMENVTSSGGTYKGTRHLKIYDGKFNLKEEITVSDKTKMILPKGYQLKYDDNGDSTYTAYLVGDGKSTGNSSMGLYIFLGIGVLIIGVIGYILLNKKKSFQ